MTALVFGLQVLGMLWQPAITRDACFFFVLYVYRTDLSPGICCFVLFSPEQLGSLQQKDMNVLVWVPLQTDLLNFPRKKKKKLSLHHRASGF